MRLWTIGSPFNESTFPALDTYALVPDYCCNYDRPVSKWKRTNITASENTKNVFFGGDPRADRPGPVWLAVEVVRYRTPPGDRTSILNLNILSSHPHPYASSPWPVLSLSSSSFPSSLWCQRLLRIYNFLSYAFQPHTLTGRTRRATNLQSQITRLASDTSFSLRPTSTRPTAAFV